jgi:hypothetical protein
MNQLPVCPRCNKQPLLPLSDYGEMGSSLKYKAWVCADSKCGYSVRIDKGQVSYVKVRTEVKNGR